MKNDWPKTGAVMVIYSVGQTAIYQDADDGMLYMRNPIGRTRMIPFDQLACIIQAAVLCQCRYCTVCRIYELTQIIANSPDEDA